VGDFLLVLIELFSIGVTAEVNISSTSKSAINKGNCLVTYLLSYFLNTHSSRSLLAYCISHIQNSSLQRTEGNSRELMIRSSRDRLMAWSGTGSWVMRVEVRGPTARHRHDKVSH